MRALANAWLVATCVACGSAPAPVTPMPSPPIAHAPLPPARYAFTCPDTVAADCPRARTTIDATLARLAAEFEDVGGAKLLDGVDFRITLDAFPRGTPRFVIESGVDRDRYYAFVTLQAPSLLDATGRTLVGEPFDLAFFEQTTAHELSSIFLDRATRTKREGWHFYGAPNWFVQGFEEYAALTFSTDHARTVTLPKYVATVRGDRARIRFSRAALGFTVKDAYVDGAVLVDFLHQTFGRDQVHAILRSPAPTFEQALESELGVLTEGLLERFGVWLDKQ